MCDGHSREGANVSETIQNLRQPMPLGRKARLLIRNNWKKIRTGKSCCGNFGEPGC